MARTAVVAGTATAVVGGVQGRQQSKANAAQQAQQDAVESQAEMAEMQQQVAALQAQQAPAAAPPTDLIGELEKLASLKSAGILSDEEFAAAKAKLLG